MKQILRTLMLALALVPILPAQPLRAADSDDNPKARISQIVDYMNQMIAEMAADMNEEVPLRFDLTPGHVSMEVLNEGFPDDPSEIAEAMLEVEEGKKELVYDAMCGEDMFAASLCELLQLLAQTDGTFNFDFVDKYNPQNRIPMHFTNAELIDLLGDFDDYARHRREIYESGDIDDILEFEGIDVGALREDTTDLVEEFEFPAINMEMLEDAATSLELMMANYYWDNEEAGNPNRIWREDDLVIASFVVGSDEKTEIASFLVSEEDTANFGYGLLISLIGHIDGPLAKDDDFDWMTFFCLVVTLDYDMDFHLMDSPDDAEPLVIHMPVSELKSFF